MVVHRKVLGASARCCRDQDWWHLAAGLTKSRWAWHVSVILPDVRLSQRWYERQKRARQERPTTIVVERSTDIARPPQDVWEFLGPAEHAAFTDPTVVRAFRVPGTPDGVGEQQAFVHRVNGREVIKMLEVIESRPGELAVARRIGSGGSADGERSWWRLTPSESGTRLTYGTEYHLPAHTWSQREMVEREAGDHQEKYLDRVRAILHSGWNPESTNLSSKNVG